MKPLSGLFKRAKEKLAAFAKEKARQKDNFNVYINKLMIDGIVNLPEVIKKQNEFVNQVLAKADVTDEEKAEALKQVVDTIHQAVIHAPALEALNKAVNKGADKEAGNQLIKLSFAEAVRLVDKISKTAQVVEGVSQKYVKQLDAYNKKLINFYKVYDGQKVSAFTSLTTKVYSSINVFLVVIFRSINAFNYAVGNIVRGTKVNGSDDLNDQVAKEKGYRQ